MKIYENLSIDSLPNEEWRDVVGYEEAYQVSSLGRIRSKDRIVVSDYYKNRHERGRVLKQQFDKDGYLVFNAKWRGKNQMLKVHRELAKAFIPNLDNLSSIDHIDGKRDNNSITNLRWCSNRQNNSYDLARQNKSLAVSKSYENNPSLRNTRAILFRKIKSKPIIAFFNGQHCGIFDSQREASVFCGISESIVSSITLGKKESYKGYTFKRKYE